MHELAIRHPYVIGGVFAVLTALCAFNAFRGGVAVGEMKILDAIERDGMRAASEALGG